MQDKRFGNDLSAIETRFAAQRIAFAPIVFQTTRLLRTTGLLEALETQGAKGMTPAEAARTTELSAYAATILLECGLAADLVAYQDERFVLTPLGAFIRRDEMTAVNMEFVHEVCYLGMHALEDALRKGEPAGLRVFGEWKTVYEALAHLPAPAKDAWLRFDHFYSDAAFPAASRIVLGKTPKTLLDIGCNTGKWATFCLSRSEDLRVTLVDLPGQLDMAMKNLAEKGLDARATPVPVDVLDPNAPFPEGFDAVWMSQFLVCFSEDEVRSILARARRSVAPGGRVFILDTFWDRQRFDAAAYCLINTSPYFTAIANGNSRMYRAEDILAIAKDVGLGLKAEHGLLGYYHTLLELAPED